MPLLQWFKRDEDLTKAARAPYRLLEPVPSLHYGEVDSPNMLIEGDNLDALKALLPYYAGQVKCIFIDPPYNTKSAFEHYDDNLEHSQWLSMMYPRLELLRELLAVDGSIWVTIDDNEGHYLKVLMDEIFGRSRFVASNIWQKRYSRDNNSAIGDVHDYVLCYAVNPEKFKQIRNRVAVDSKTRSFYRNPNDDPKGPWRLIPMNGAGLRPNQQYPVSTPSGKTIYPPEGRHWSVLEDKFLELVAQGKVYFGKKGDASPGLIRYLSEVDGLVPWTWWPHEEVGHTDESKKEMHRIFGVADAFDTPKPERLLQRIIHIASNPGDLVLDSFLGSGTTAAVAHKMRRRWIGIETGDHARTHCLPRLRRVVDGEQGGISEIVGWPVSGGGGFRFFKLGSPVFDENGRIRDGIKFEHLAAHVWFSETGTPRTTRAKREPFLGEHRGIGYYLLYNGILGDKSNGGGNVLTKRLLRDLPAFDGPRVIYGEACLLSDDRLRELNITFKQTPYDIKAR